jgi:predicted RNase H-like HicB family nuclease
MPLTRHQNKSHQVPGVARKKRSQPLAIFFVAADAASSPLCQSIEGAMIAAMRRLLIVIEDAGTNYSAYSPDLPGCVATGGTPEEVEKNMREAIQLHIEGLQEDDLPIPISYADRRIR